MTTLYTGYWALGHGTGTTFTEVTGTGYARVAGAVVTASSNRHTNSAIATFTASAGDWTSVKQIALYSASSSGTNKLFWNISIPHTVGNGASFTIKALSLNLFLNDAFYRTGASNTFATNDVIGHDAGGNSIYAGSGWTVKSGVLQATSAVVYSATGALPTADPHVLGALWSNSGTITVSAG